MEKDFFFVEEKEKEENIWRKNIWPTEEKEREEIIWKRKMFFCGGEEKQRRRRRQIFGEGRYHCLWVKRRTEKEKEQNIWRRNFVGRRVAKALKEDLKIAVSTV